MCIDLLFPVDQTELTQLLQLRHLRRVGLPDSTFFGSKSMYGDQSSMILEVNSPLSAHHYWKLCTQMIAVSSSKILVHSNAAAEVWTETLDMVLAMDVHSAATKLKRKPSKNGGRPVASPSATSSVLAASKKTGDKPSSTLDYITDLAVRGEVGREDGEVLRLLIAHACTATGCTIKETDAGSNPKLGEYIHLAPCDPSAPPGRLR